MCMVLESRHTGVMGGVAALDTTLVESANTLVAEMRAKGLLEGLERRCRGGCVGGYGCVHVCIHAYLGVCPNHYSRHLYLHFQGVHHHSVSKSGPGRHCHGNNVQLPAPQHVTLGRQSRCVKGKVQGG